MSNDPTRDAVLRSRGELLHTVSHDLRGPLSSIAVALDGLRDQSVAPGTREKYLGAIERAIGKAERLLHDLLTAHQIEAGTLTVEPRPVPVRPLLEEVARDHETAARSARAQLAVVIEGGVESIVADRGRIAQALAALVANALRHGRGGPSVELIARPGAGGGVVLAVRDHGPGASADVLPHLFDPSWPGHHKRGAIGLALVHGIARLHGGDARAEPTPGGGLTVLVELPAAAPR